MYNGVLVIARRLQGIIRMKENVSLWLGNFNDFDQLEKYIEAKYNDDGDSIPSIFEKDFRLGYFDRDLIEKDCITNADNML